MLEPKVFDNTALRESRLTYNHELMTLVASESIKEATVFLDMLQAHMMDEGWENFALVAHRLKGAALEVSGYRFCQLITEMERVAIQGKGDQLPIRYTALR
ncbi:Hpt domain-containing protein [Marinomonas rhodophyticola]|uniref:Hpt domain-containing protein n=2 Tax=Marinomonas TaxID=28253 RepID=A0ABT3KJQ5_9GAMM|nr:Hpt domain-containing protein [Marinomonas sp. KJ51-3]MCW4630772.1 Hpt domain-containing protein [Marinomonas sp. KJ51-3]